METTVKKIHREFREAINTSTIQLNDETNVKQFGKSKEYKDMLESVGLVKSKAMREVSKVVDKHNTIITDNAANKELLENQAWFPNNRLIGINKVLDICKKYNLFLAKIEQYTGDIPERNLVEITNFKRSLNNYDKNWALEYDNYNKSFKATQAGKFGNNLLIVAPMNLLDVDSNTYVFGNVAITNNVKQYDPGRFKFEFKMPEFKMPSFALDPIVLYPSVNNSVGKFLNIVTAWGEEADDEYVTSKVKIEQNEN